MPIVKYVAVHTTPLSNIEYILNGDKNDEMKFATGINCTANPQEAYDEFRRTFEICAKERFFKSEIVADKDKSEKPKQKEKVRIHHYIQSFSPDENVTPEEAHQIGIEWAKKVFGNDHQVIVSTHVDKDHIHNHFAVCPYNLDGKQWYANYRSLMKVRKISDAIALEHGLHIIERPKHKNTMKYNEWLTRKNGTSWKQKLCNNIDKIILDENVKSVQDIALKLSEMGYVIRQGKYLSIKAPKQKYAIRSFRLGDGYSVPELEYRVLHKDKEISLAAIERYSGVQREYAICMRQMQINVFYRKEKRTTYADLIKSAELLNYLSSNNITSVNEFEKRLNSAAEKFQSVSNSHKIMSEQVKTIEQIIEDGKIFLKLSDKDFLTFNEKAEYKKVAYVSDGGISSQADLNNRKAKLEELKRKLSETEKQIEPLRTERDTISGYYKAYRKNIEEASYEDIRKQVEMLQSDREERSETKLYYERDW
mgnify:FL=1